MIIRKIRPEELKRVTQMSAHAFEYRVPHSELTAQELVEKKQKEPKSRQDLCWDCHWAAFEDDNTTMISSFLAIPYQVHFDGHTVPMAGIGNVCTLPQYRRSGAIRKSFETFLPDQYQNGTVFTYLFPFSSAFYRKFGYELGCERAAYKLKISGIPQRNVPGTCHLLEQGEILESLKADIRRLDRRWIEQYNLMVVEEDIEYQWMDDVNPFHDVNYTYVYRDETGEAQGYVTYRPREQEGDSMLECTCIRFLTSDAFKALLEIPRSMAAFRSHILLYLPVDIDLGGLLEEWSQDMVICKREPAGMVRVVNVEESLRLAKMRGTGSLVIEVQDGQIAENNDRFEVIFNDGVTSQVCRSKKEPDIRLSINDFSRMICGRCDLTALAFQPGVELLCDAEKAAKVFYRKPMYISRYF